MSIFISLIEEIKIQWSLMRILRLLMGLILFAQGIFSQQWIAALLGIGFSLMPIFNLGCGCEGSACPYNPKSTKPDE